MCVRVCVCCLVNIFLMDFMSYYSIQATDVGCADRRTHGRIWKTNKNQLLKFSCLKSLLSFSVANAVSECSSNFCFYGCECVYFVLDSDDHMSWVKGAKIVRIITVGKECEFNVKLRLTVFVNYLPLVSISNTGNRKGHPMVKHKMYVFITI